MQLMKLLANLASRRQAIDGVMSVLINMEVFSFPISDSVLNFCFLPGLEFELPEMTMYRRGHADTFFFFFCKFQTAGGVTEFSFRSQ